MNIQRMEQRIWFSFLLLLILDLFNLPTVILSIFYGDIFYNYILRSSESCGMIIIFWRRNILKMKLCNSDNDKCEILVERDNLFASIYT